MKSKERRAAIIDGSVRQFAAKGFRGTTTRDLASALGVSEPVLYQHFPAKKDLYAAIIEEKAREDFGTVEELAGFVGADRDFFERLATLILERYEKDQCFVRLLLFSALEGHELAELFFENRVRRFYDIVGGYIRSRMDAGAFRPMDPLLAARAFIGMISYHGLMKVLFPERVVTAGRAQVVSGMVEVFLEGIRSKR
jgi:AcrR family transcriptional regulator